MADYEAGRHWIETGSGRLEEDGEMTEAHERKRRKYLNTYARITYDSVVLRIRCDGCGKGVLEGVTREDIKAAAAAAGMSMNEFILERACESMRGRGEVFGGSADRDSIKNEMFAVRGETAAELIATARELGEEPREMVLNAVRRYYEEKMKEGR